jgi:hypothetical protein
MNIMTFIHAVHGMMSLTNLVYLVNTASILPDRRGNNDSGAKILDINVGKVPGGSFQILLDQATRYRMINVCGVRLVKFSAPFSVSMTVLEIK